MVMTDNEPDLGCYEQELKAFAQRVWEVEVESADSTVTFDTRLSSSACVGVDVGKQDPMFNGRSSGALSRSGA